VPIDCTELEAGQTESVMVCVDESWNRDVPLRPDRLRFGTFMYELVELPDCLDTAVSNEDCPVG